jgi:competence protein ComEA
MRTAEPSTSIVARVRDSVWWPLCVKLAGLSLLFAGLALLGAGVLDRAWPPAAHAAAPPPAAPSAIAPPIDAASAIVPTAAVGSAPTAAASTGPASEPKPSASAAVLPDGRVVLNLATADELDRLPGIGRAKAEAIVALRARLGGKFRRLEELTRVRGIKRKLLERLRPRVVLDPPPSEAP